MKGGMEEKGRYSGRSEWGEVFSTSVQYKCSVQVLGGAECVIFGHAAFIQKEARSECEDCANLSSIFSEICRHFHS